LQFDVTAGRTTGLGFHDLANDFFLGFFVGEKDELPGRERCGDADDGPMGEDQNGLGSFGKRFALVGTFDGAGAVDGDGNFEWNGLRAGGRFVG